MEFRTCIPTACPPPASQHGKQRQLPASAGPETGGVCRLPPEKTLRQIPPAPMDKAPGLPPSTTGGLDLGDPQLPVNFVSPTYRLPEKLVPRPPFRPKLKSNPWINQHFQKPCYLSYVDRQLALRRLAEKKNEEFHFPPLLPCLENIQIFVDHIRSGAQFDGALTTEEHQALAWVHKTAAQLAKAGVPYKRTVRLAMILMTLCEIMTARQVLDPLQSNPAGTAQGRIITHPPVSLTPEEVCSLIWTNRRDMDPDQYSKQVAKKLGESVKDLLCDMLENKTFFVFPTFQELDLPDFCQFGHLPLHPVGLITDYALNADSRMMSPLEFAVHDIGHMFTLRNIGADQIPITTAADIVLHSPLQRLALRQLLLDQMPAPLAALQLRPALVLLLFQLLHEERPAEAAGGLNSGSQAFAYCLQQLAYARRNQRSAYSKKYQDIPDTLAAMAALWVVRLWQCWQDADGQPLTADQVHSCLQAFETQDLPRLREHLDFIKRHRACLRLLFLERFTVSYASCDSEGDFFAYFGVALGERLHGRTLFQQKHHYNGVCHLDNTDLGYFAAYSQPALRELMEEATGARLPAAIALGKRHSRIGSGSGP